MYNYTYVIVRSETIINNSGPEKEHLSRSLYIRGLTRACTVVVVTWQLTHNNAAQFVMQFITAL